MLNLNYSYQSSKKAPRNITLRNTSISKSKLLSSSPEAWGEGEWIPEAPKRIVAPGEVVKLQWTLREGKIVF